jgi:hypothetical protein
MLNLHYDFLNVLFYKIFLQVFQSKNPKDLIALKT